MSSQLITQFDALRLFFTEDIYLIKDQEVFNIRREVSGAEAESNELHAQETIEQSKTLYSSFDHLGKNQKKILILVNDAVNKVSTEKGSELLRNIVKAINLNANDFALVNYAQYQEASYGHFKSFFSPTLTFCFGVSATSLLLAEQPLNEIHLLDNARIIFCDNLDALTDDQQSKKALWASLKQLGL